MKELISLLKVMLLMSLVVSVSQAIQLPKSKSVETTKVKDTATLEDTKTYKYYCQDNCSGSFKSKAELIKHENTSEGAIECRENYKAKALLGDEDSPRCAVVCILLFSDAPSSIVEQVAWSIVAGYHYGRDEGKNMRKVFNIEQPDYIINKGKKLSLNYINIIIQNQEKRRIETGLDERGDKK